MLARTARTAARSLGLTSPAAAMRQYHFLKGATACNVFNLNAETGNFDTVKDYVNIFAEDPPAGLGQLGEADEFMPSGSFLVACEAQDADGTPRVFSFEITGAEPNTPTAISFMKPEIADSNTYERFIYMSGFAAQVEDVPHGVADVTVSHRIYPLKEGTDYQELLNAVENNESGFKSANGASGLTWFCAGLDEAKTRNPTARTYQLGGQNKADVPFGLATVSVYLGHGSDGAGKGAAEADAIGISAFTDGDAIENTYNGVMVTK